LCGLPPRGQTSDNARSEENRVSNPAHSRLRADQRPLYVQAVEALRALLHSGEYTPGDRMPSELELSQRLGISRPTLREALRLLEDEGAIQRRHGVGTFMSSPRPIIESGLEVLESVERQALRIGLSTEMADLRLEERAATPVELEQLGLVLPTSVTVIERVIVADALPVAFLSDCVPVHYLRRDDLPKSFKGSVLDFLIERGWPTLAYSRTELAPESADGILMQNLHLGRASALLRLDAQLYATDGRVVDYSVSHFVSGHFRFHVVRRIGATASSTISTQAPGE
jgi:GntR family transcriptional regulator